MMLGKEESESKLGVSGDVKPSGAKVLIQVDYDLYQTSGPADPIDALAQAVDAANRDHGQGSGCTLLAHSLFQRIVAVHVPVARQQEHPVLLGISPYDAVIGVGRQLLRLERRHLKRQQI